MTAITIEKAIVHRALSALEYHTQQTRLIHNTELVIEELRAALSAPATAPAIQYPPLPIVAALLHSDGYWTSVAGGPLRPKPDNFSNKEVFTADQMRAYVDADRAQRVPSSADDLRALGWTVAVHNDYRLNGVAHTFWLLTKDGRCIKGEGLSDADALKEIRTMLSAAPQAQPEQHPFPHEGMDKVALDRYKVAKSISTIWPYSVAAGDGNQELFHGSESTCKHVARKLAGAFLDGAFYAHAQRQKELEASTCYMTNDATREECIRQAIEQDRALREQAQPSKQVLENIDELMSQAQVMASAWSLVGSRFDNGSAMQDFEEAKQELRDMLSAAQQAQPATAPAHTEAEASKT